MNFKRITSVFPEWGWAALIVLLPITSMPLVAKIVGGGNTVASPSGLILLALMVFWLVPNLGNGGSLPRTSVPLWGFVLAASISTTAATFLWIPPVKDNSSIRNELEALLTLGIGLSFYLAAATWPNSEKKMTLTLRLINWSGLAVILWSLVQAGAWYTGNRYPIWLRSIHEIYSIGPLFRQRASGFALEPSWLAHQLNLLYLPLWLAFTVRRKSVHRIKVGGLSFENLLLVSGAAVLFLTLSRIGLAAFMVMIAWVMITAGWSLSDRVVKHLTIRWGHKVSINPNLFKLLFLTAIITVIILLIVGLGAGLSKIDQRMANLFTFDLNRPDAIQYYANQLTFASRLTYWKAGWSVFEDFPWLGVGLGNAGFFMPPRIDGYGWTLVEVRDLIYRSGGLLNIKSIWIRLLAETGIFGFSFFLTWVWILWRKSRRLKSSFQPVASGLGLFGMLVVIGFLLEGFSIDSFAMPYAWVSLGLISAVPRNGY